AASGCQGALKFARAARRPRPPRLLVAVSSRPREPSARAVAGVACPARAILPASDQRAAAGPAARGGTMNEARGEAILDQAVAVAQETWGARLLAAYALGSLAH